MINIDTLKNLSILYAEDDVIVAESTERMLSVLCNNVIVATDGVATIELYEKEKPNIVILDIKMPLINGLEVASIIRKTDQVTPIIIATSYKESDDILKAIKLNLAAYIIKPFKFNDLRVALLDAIERLHSHGMLKKQITNKLSYNFTTKMLIKDGIFIKLTKNETILFELLLQRQGALVSYNYIEKHIGLEYFTTKASIKNTIFRFRKKIDDKIIVNVQDLGYMLL